MKELERTQNDYYKESKRLRQEVLELAEQLKNNPMPLLTNTPFWQALKN